ncbi:MAG: hypothetical protein IPJ41_06245 [Phycisphaerales bacterium]|nr:hypothetical protein [Phycisphaerales bacterium]
MTFAMVLVAAAGFARAGVVTSTFDVNAEGWLVADGDSPSNQSTTATPVYNGVAGNFGGFVTPPLKWSTEAFLIAPTKFVGDQSSNIGGSISVDRRFYEPGVISQPLQFDYPVDLTMTGASMSIGVDLAPVPLLSWDTQTVDLTTAAGWFHLDTGIPATADEINAVVADLVDIRVRANLNDAGGNIGMDNFTLAPTPGSIALLVIAGASTLRRRRA